MIDHLDNLLRDLFLGHVAGLTDEAQVRFQPPDEDWRTYVSNLTVDGQPANALNVHVADLRENHKLRVAGESRWSDSYPSAPCDKVVLIEQLNVYFNIAGGAK